DIKGNFVYRAAPHYHSYLRAFVFKAAVEVAAAVNALKIADFSLYQDRREMLAHMGLNLTTQFGDAKNSRARWTYCFAHLLNDHSFFDDHRGLAAWSVIKKRRLCRGGSFLCCHRESIG